MITTAKDRRCVSIFESVCANLKVCECAPFVKLAKIIDLEHFVTYGRQVEQMHGAPSVPVFFLASQPFCDK